MIPLSSISEAVKNHDDTKIFRPADYDDFMRWLDYADTEEKLFSRLGYWMVMQGLPDDRNQKYDMVRERAQELKLWNGLELKLRRWMDNSAEEFKRLGEKAYTALIGQDYASYKNNAPSEPAKALAPLCLKDIHGEDTKWLVPGVIPLGEISLLGADGGTGKGIWQAQLIAYVTTGQTSSFFPDSPQQTGKVLILSGEDDPRKVLKGRIAAAGADMSRVLVVTADEYYIQTGKQLCIKDKALADFVDTSEPILLILDPLQSFLPSDVDMAKRNQMRGATLPLKGISSKHNLSTLISMHTNKKQGVSDRARLADSSDLWDIARSVLMMGRDRNTKQIYISHEKSSYSKPAQTVLMHIEDITVDGLKTAKAVFDGYSTKKDADFVEERRFKVAQTKDDTAQVILNILAESNTASMANPQLKSAVMLETECSERTYKQAYAELVKSGEIAKYQLNQKGSKRGWFTRLAYRGETDCTLTDI